MASNPYNSSEEEPEYLLEAEEEPDDNEEIEENYDSSPDSEEEEEESDVEVIEIPPIGEEEEEEDDYRYDDDEEEEEDEEEEREINGVDIGRGEGEECEENSDLGKASGVPLDRPSLPNCPICFEPWTSDGPHRICCFPCGHVYGRSCLEKWLQRCGETTGKCPQCNRKFRQKEIVNLYAPVIVVPMDGLEKEMRYLREENESLKLESQLRELSSQQTEDHISGQNLGEERNGCVRCLELGASPDDIWVPSSPANATRATDATVRKIAELSERVTAMEVQMSQLAGLEAQLSRLADLQSEMAELRSEMADLRGEMAEVRRMCAEVRRMQTETQVTKRRRPNNAGGGASGGVR